jgi:hypothetical protein
MTRFATTADQVTLVHVAPPQWLGALAAKFLAAAGDTVKRNYFSIAWGGNLFRLIYWLVTGGIVVALIQRRWRLALRAGALLGLALAADAFSGLRYWAEHYRIFAEPWLLVAGGLLLAAVDWRHRAAAWRQGARAGIFRTGAVAAGVVLLAVVYGILTGALAKRPPQPADMPCDEAKAYIPDLIGHFCRGT